MGIHVLCQHYRQRLSLLHHGIGPATLITEGPKMTHQVGNLVLWSTFLPLTFLPSGINVRFGGGGESANTLGSFSDVRSRHSLPDLDVSSPRTAIFPAAFWAHLPCPENHGETDTSSCNPWESSSCYSEQGTSAFQP